MKEISMEMFFVLHWIGIFAVGVPLGFFIEWLMRKDNWGDDDGKAD